MDFQSLNLILIVPVVLAGLMAIAMITYLASGLFMVRGNEQRVVIELMGEYWRTAGPGLNWRPRAFSSIRATLDIREWGIPIFDKGDVKIDLADGWIKPVSAMLFVRLTDPLKDGQRPPRAVYEVGDWESSIKSLAETLTASYLRSFPLEEVLQEGRGGFDIAAQINLRSKELKREAESADPDQHRTKLQKMHADLKKAYAEIKRTERLWGIKITQIFIPDYELSPELRRARDEVHESERRAKAALFRIRQMAQESGGLHALIKEILVKDYNYDPERAEEIASEYVIYFRGTEKGSIIDIRGGGDLTGPLAQIVALIEKMKGAGKGSKSP